VTIFDQISDILFKKKNTCINSVDEEQSFSPYLVSRWISMYSPKCAKICNEINKYLGVFDSKKTLYSFYISQFDKTPAKKINYFKKQKTDSNKTEQDSLILNLSKYYELSKREINEYISMLNFNKN